MKNKILLGALLLGVTGLFTSCKDDNDSNPTLIQPSEFVLNTPSYANQVVTLENNDEGLDLTWSQPQYTSDNAPIGLYSGGLYLVQISPTGKFTVSTDEADADKTLTADYFTYTTADNGVCHINIPATELDKKLQKIIGWSKTNVPTNQSIYVRVKSSLAQEGSSTERGVIYSNIVKLMVNPYYILLEKAEPLLWFLVGNNIMDGNWSKALGTSMAPFFLEGEYDEENGTGIVTYENYFTTDGYKIQPGDFNWDYGFGGDGANKLKYRDGGTDPNNAWMDPAGYYKITIDTKALTGTVEVQNITPTVYTTVQMRGTFDDGNWDPGVTMSPVNKSGENHVWITTVTVSNNEGAQFKFVVDGTWCGFSLEEGTVSTYGKVAKGGGNNLGLAKGTWVVSYNDITDQYTILSKDSYNTNVYGR